MSQQISLASYEERKNKNQKLYLVLKDEGGDTFMCTNPMLFDLIKSSIVIDADVKVEVVGSARFQKIEGAVTLQAGELTKADPKPPWTGGNKSGGGSGGGGSFKADPYKQALIIRQNVLDRGFDAALYAAKEGKLVLADGETDLQALVRVAMGVAVKLESWVRAAEPVVDPTPVPAAAPPATPPTPAPATPAAPPVAAPPAPSPAPSAPVGDDDLPF